MNQKEILTIFLSRYIAEEKSFDFSNKIFLLNLVKGSNEQQLENTFVLLDPFNENEISLSEDKPSVMDLVNKVKDLKVKELRLKQVIYKGLSSKDDYHRMNNIRDSIARNRKKIKDLINNKPSGSTGSTGTPSQTAAQTMTASDKIAQFASENPATTAIATAAAVAAISALAIAAYRKYFNKSQHRCANAPEGKTACIAKIKREAREAKLRALKAGRDKCTHAKYPYLCKDKVDRKIAAIEAKI